MEEYKSDYHFGRAMTLAIDDADEAEDLALALSVAIQNMRCRGEVEHLPFIKRVEKIYAKVADGLGCSVDDLDCWVWDFSCFDVVKAANVTLLVRRGPAKPMKLEDWTKNEDDVNDWDLSEEEDEESVGEGLEKGAAPSPAKRH